ncbi:MAG: hypothetical protein ABSG90_11385 [Dehalococcoidia bacterium]
MENDYWPHFLEEKGVFLDALEIVRVRDFNNLPFLYKFEFSNQFMDEIAAAGSNRLRILQQIVKRLILTRQNAARDGSLQDEYISTEREHRFRVTPRPSSIRIHYNYLNGNDIKFLHYYDVGHHDDGL